MRLPAQVTAIENRLFDSLRSRTADRAATEAAVGAVESFRGRRQCLLVTYRKDGTPVPSPVWFGERDSRLYVHTGGWKLKRILANPHVRVAPCTFRGKPLGPPLEGKARVLPAEERPAAEAALDANIGAARRLYYVTVGRGQHDLAEYVEITPF